jgi:hypothetical protein
MWVAVHALPADSLHSAVAEATADILLQACVGAQIVALFYPPPPLHTFYPLPPPLTLQPTDLCPVTPSGWMLS